MRILYLLGVASLALPSPAAAQEPVSGSVTLTGAVQDRCLFTTAAATINIPELAQGGSGAGAGRLDLSKVNGQTRTLVGWCNGSAATMTVEAQPLLNQDVLDTPSGGGFDRRIDYSASALANSVTADDNSVEAGAGAAKPVGLFTGNVVVTLSGASSPTSGLLVAGRYEGAVIVTLAPNISFGKALGASD